MRCQWSIVGAFCAVALPACALDETAVQAPTASSPTGMVSPADALRLDTALQALTQRIRKELVFMPGGTFEMGDWGNDQGLPYDGFAEGNNRPLHTVTLDAFSMMAYKVTYEDFDLFTDAVGEARINMDSFGLKYRAPRKPAGVNWYGAKAYCEWLGKLAGLPFDLPTEAQWEYAARSGGKKVLFATDNGSIDKDRNYPWTRKDRTTPEVGSFPPNPAGLFGMSDYLASEWVNDWYDPDYYKRSPRSNPRGPDEGKPASPMHPQLGPAKVIRGHASPGNSPAFGGFVFSRGAREPKEIRSASLAKSPGFSGMPSKQFRCVVQQSTPIR